MSNTAGHTVTHSTSRLFVEWLSIVIGLSITGMIIRLSFYNPTWAGPDFNPWSELMSIIAISAFGWVSLGLIGPLWLIILSLILAIHLKSRSYFFIAGVTSLTCGLLWPPLFWAMMSV